MQLTGIHHLTAISANAPGNKRFYTGTLGMRMVKKTVNQDDTSAYHLFYADALANPGTDLTFFDWPAPAERRGTHSIARTALRVAGARHVYLVEGPARQGRRDDRRDRRARRPRHARLRGPGGPAAFAGRRRREGRGVSVGEEPGAGGSIRSAGSARSRSACRASRRPKPC